MSSVNRRYTTDKQSREYQKLSGIPLSEFIHGDSRAASNNNVSGRDNPLNVSPTGTSTQLVDERPTKGIHPSPQGRLANPSVDVPFLVKHPGERSNVACHCLSSKTPVSSVISHRGSHVPGGTFTSFFDASMSPSRGSGSTASTRGVSFAPSLITIPTGQAVMQQSDLNLLSPTTTGVNVTPFAGNFPGHLVSSATAFPRESRFTTLTLAACSRPSSHGAALLDSSKHARPTTATQGGCGSPSTPDGSRVAAARLSDTPKPDTTVTSEDAEKMGRQITQLLRETVVLVNKLQEGAGHIAFGHQRDVMELYNIMDLEDDTLAGAPKLQRQLQAFQFPPPNMERLQTLPTADDEVVVYMIGEEEKARRERHALHWQRRRASTDPPHPFVAQYTTEDFADRDSDRGGLRGRLLPGSYGRCEEIRCHQRLIVQATSLSDSSYGDESDSNSVVASNVSASPNGGEALDE